METSLQEWIDKEFEYLNLGDRRLDKRLKKVALGLAKNSEKNISSSLGPWGEVKAAYRFFDDSKVTSKKILF